MNIPLSNAEISQDLAIEQRGQVTESKQMQDMADFLDDHCGGDWYGFINKFDGCPAESPEHHVGDDWGLFIACMNYLDLEVAAKAWIDYREAKDLRLSFYKTDPEGSYFYGMDDGVPIVVQIKLNDESKFMYFMSISELSEMPMDGAVIWRGGTVDFCWGIDDPLELQAYELNHLQAS